MIIANGMIFVESGKFRKGNITIADGKIKSIAYFDEKNGAWNVDAGDKMLKLTDNCSSEEIIDAEGMYVIPGLVDIHFHGCKGYDFCDGTKEAFDKITEYQARNGVTSICPATMTLSREELGRIFAAVGRYSNEEGSTIRGVTMEGPFLSQAKRGAQNSAYLHKPDVEFFREMQELSGGIIKQVAVAPEEDEDLKFIRAISQETVVSVAHTTADYELATEAFRAGATHVTHLFNAMQAFSHRAPGVVGAAYDDEDVFVELICDGIHIHPSMVRAVFTLFGAQRICMISDSMSATGMPDGKYALGGQEVTVTGSMAKLKDGIIAGSVSSLYDCLRKTVLEMGVSLEEAVLACTGTPARSLGIEEKCGRLAVDRQADMVILDENLKIKSVICRGEIFAEKCADK